MVLISFYLSLGRAVRLSPVFRWIIVRAGSTSLSRSPSRATDFCQVLMTRPANVMGRPVPPTAHSFIAASLGESVVVLSP